MRRFVRLTTIAVGAFAVLCGLCDSAQADEAPVRQYYVDERLPPPSTRWKLMLGGLGATAGFYALAQPFSYAWPEVPSNYDLRYPVVGPWLAIADDVCPPEDPECSTPWRVVKGILYALNGLGQAGGLAIAIEGAFLPTGAVAKDSDGPGPTKRTIPHRRSTDPPAEPNSPPPPPGQLFYIPRPVVVGQRGVGLGFGGVF